MITIDFTGIEEWDPNGGGGPPEEGVYQGVCNEVDEHYNGGKSTEFGVTLEGGRPARLFIGNQPSEKGGNQKKWRTALVGIATDPEKFSAMLDTNPKFQPFDPAKLFVGKKVYVSVRAVPGINPQNGKPNWPSIEFMTRAQYEAAKAAEASGAVKPSASPAAQGAPAAAAGGSILSTMFG
jgi:hypothetical protein